MFIRRPQRRLFLDEVGAGGGVILGQQDETLPFMMAQNDDMSQTDIAAMDYS